MVRYCMAPGKKQIVTKQDIPSVLNFSNHYTSITMRRRLLYKEEILAEGSHLKISPFVLQKCLIHEFFAGLPIEQKLFSMAVF